MAWAGLRCLSLTWGQCEGLTVGISAEEILPRFFYFHKLHTNHIAEQGVFRAEPMALLHCMLCLKQKRKLNTRVAHRSSCMAIEVSQVPTMFMLAMAGYNPKFPVFVLSLLARVGRV